MTKFKEITHKELKILRHLQWQRQKRSCPILKQEILLEDAVIDHKHKAKAEPIGEDGKGLLRGVLHFQANSWEGKVTNAFKRYGLHKFDISLPEALMNLAEYISDPPMAPEYIHPNERPKPKKLGKRDYNRIKKYYFQLYPNRRKPPEYPKSGKTNKTWEDLILKANQLHKRKR